MIVDQISLWVLDPDFVHCRIICMIRYWKLEELYFTRAHVDSVRVRHVCTDHLSHHQVFLLLPDGLDLSQ